MALFGSRQLSLIKLLHKQSCFSNKATFGLVNEFKNSKYAIIYSNNEQVRYTSTTPKKGNAFAFEYSTDLQNDLQNINKTLDLSFNDSKTAFQSKSNFELFRAYVVFQLCGINFLLDHQKTVGFILNSYISIRISISFFLIYYSFLIYPKKFSVEIFLINL